MEQILIEDLKEEYENLSADGFRVLAVAYKDVEPRAAYAKDDESRPGPERLRRVPRPAQGDGRAGHRGAAAARRDGQGAHRRQRTGEPQDLPRGRACRPSTCCWARRSRR